MAINWQKYVDANPDLGRWYDSNVKQTGQSLEDWASSHYFTHGQYEGRSVPDATPTDLANFVSYKQGGGTGTQPPGTTVPGTGTGAGSSATGTGPGTSPGTASGTSTGSTGTNWNDLITSVGGTGGTGGTNTANTTGVTPASVTTATTPTLAGGNYNQVQNANQAGVFGTSGTSVQLQTQAGGQNTTQTQAGTQTQSGTQSQTGTQTQAGTQTQTGTGTSNETNTQNTTNASTTGAVDTLGFGQLLSNATTGATADDQNRRLFLTDLMQNGGTGFQSQVDQAVRNSLSGPMMTGSGDSARARAAGYAGEQVARNNMNQRLAAASQLSGPSALTTLSGAANPYIGQTTTGATSSTGASQNVNNLSSATTSSSTGNTASTGTNTSTGTSSSAGSTNSLNWGELFNRGAEAQSGGTSAASSQAGSGLIPQGQPVQTGGCVLCTAAVELGYEKNLHVLRKVIAYKLGPGWKKFRLAARGYFAVFGPFADWLLDHPKLAKVLYPLARKVVYEELRVTGRKLPFRLDAFLVHWIGDGFCRLVGLFPVSGYVKQSRILNIAQRYNILFEVKS